MKHRRALTIVISAALLAGCAAQRPSDAAPATPQAETPEDATASATPRPTETIIPTETPVPPTVTPTVTLTPTPAGSLTQEGPWMLLYAEISPFYFPPTRQLYIMNVDGSGFRTLEDANVLDYEVHPQNRHMVAYISQYEHNAPELRLLRLPDPNPVTLTALTTEALLPDSEYKLHASAVTSGLAWSPDGTRIAFVGALDDASVDMYVFDMATSETTRIADLENYEQIYVGEYDSGFMEETQHAVGPSWSPDGRYVLFVEFGITNMGLGSDNFASRWAAAADGSRSLLVMKTGGWGTPGSYGWIDSTTVILSQSIYEGAPLVTINLDTGQVTTILEEELFQVVYAPGRHAWLLRPRFLDGKSNDNGTLQVIKPNGERVTLTGLQHAGGLRWSEEDEAFLASTDEADYQITVDGRVTKTEKAESLFVFEDWPGEHEPITSLSPDGTLMAWLSYEREIFSGLWIGEPHAEPQLIHFVEPAGYIWEEEEDLLIEYVDWTPDSQALILLTNKGVYLARRPEFEFVQISSGRTLSNPFGTTIEWLP